jgi:hypothetical protein
MKERKKMIELKNTFTRSVAEIEFSESHFLREDYPETGTTILTALADSPVHVTVKFNPDYVGSSYEGEYYFADQYGGFYFYPERYDPGFVCSQEGKIYSYQFQTGQRVMLANFPVKEKPEWTTRFLQSWGGQGS